MKDLKHCRVLVTPTSFGKHDPRLRAELEAAVGEVIYNPTDQPLSSDEVRALLPGCHGYIAGLDVIDRAALEAADALKVIARYGVGVDRIDLEAARARGIVVTNTPSANAASVAELTIGLMIALARSIPTADAATKAGQWPRFTGVALEGKTVGLIGFGSIGQQTARRLQGFDCHILTYDPAVAPEVARTHQVEWAPLEEVVAQADFLSLHLPLTPATRGMVNADFLARMKPGAFLINTARGELIDDDALVEALTSGRLRGAALDVFSREPPDPRHPLLKLPNVIVTPHAGAHTDAAMNAMGWGALRDCLAVLRGETPQHRVV
ncbi:phosphoglycerate dehydrogenase [Caldilinea sp.]|jgi:D-3-phosphoglycerate dehydrogenase|uniref:phosphoglycerate dehydrogenase n=1 Tax=Caldilinea sp. TaxID=2293560 RepID=UPI0021DDB68B|nr:phosphoglycerate dehydrogenase [Caldilinea sp.]GIV70525.1 MAG: 2-hydroxyacid dehydrogenase [Caldilinea sp.]